MGEFGKLETNQSFGEHISGHLICALMFESNYASIEHFANVVISDCDVFGAGVKSCIFHELNSRFVITMDDDRVVKDLE